jgi:hypothetical protein
MNISQNIIMEEKTQTKEDNPKKRGRRKKVVENEKTKVPISLNEVKETSSKQKKQTNIILHLSCSLDEIDSHIRQEWKHTEFSYNPNIPQDILPFESNTNNDFHVIENETKHAYKTDHLCLPCEKNIKSHTDKQDDWTPQDNQKLKELKLQFYKNEIPDKKVDCFWCTYSYDNDPYYILQHGSNNDILAHGSFCSPPCAVAFLFNNMQWDDSSKIESYQLMNYYYNSNNYTESIKPACSPYYFLDKYYGNMTIQEFRKLSNTNYIFLCVDKPVTRVLPEIHEENDKASNINNKGNYKVKKQSEKAGTINRNDILKSNFGVKV